MPTHTNHMGNTFGGQIMAWMAAGLNRLNSALSSAVGGETAGQGSEDGCLAAPQAGLLLRERCDLPMSTWTEGCLVRPKMVLMMAAHPLALEAGAYCRKPVEHLWTCRHKAVLRAGVDRIQVEQLKEG